MKIMKNRIRTEPFDLMQYFYTSVHDPLIRTLIRFSGRLDPEVLKRAVDLSASAVPQIRCRFSARSHGWEDCGFTAEDMVRVTRTAEESTETAERLLLDTIRFGTEPHLKLHLVRGPESDTLCVIISHLVSDGVGFKQYLYLLASLYRRCLGNNGYIVPPEPWERDAGQIFRSISVGDRLKILRSPMKFEKQKNDMLLPLKDGDGRPFTVLRRIGAGRLAALKSYAKDRGTTLNDLLIAAYGRAHHALTGCTECELPCPVDLRKYLAPDARCGVCNLTGSYVCRFSVRKKEPFDETLKKVASQLSEQKGSMNCLKGPMLLEFLFSVMPYPAVKKMFEKTFFIPVVSFTNLGILDADGLDFGIPAADAYLTTAVKHPPFFQVSVSTFADCCTLSSNLCSTDRDRAVVERFLDRMMDELPVSEDGRIKLCGKTQTKAGGGSHAEGQPAGQQTKQSTKGRRTDSAHRGKSESKQKRQKTVR